MIKVKDGYAKLINTSYTGDISLVLLSNGGTIGYDVSTNTILATIGSNVASADKLKTARKLWGLDFDGTADVNGSLTGVTSINMDGDIVINDGTNHDRYIKWLYNNTDNYGWRIGYLGSGSSDNNDLTFDSHRKLEGWASALYFKHTTLNAHFAGTVIAPTFQGNLDGTYINKLTGYSKATSGQNVAETDTLNTALGKVEYKSHFAYDWITAVTASDTDKYINKWGEIVAFLDSVKEGTDILEEFVTRKSDLDVTGKKTFINSDGTYFRYENNGVRLIGSGEYGYLQLGLIVGDGTKVHKGKITGISAHTLTSLDIASFASTFSGTVTANKFVSGNGVNDFSAGTVKLDTLNIPTSNGGTTFGPGSNGLVLKSNGTTVYWASDSNSNSWRAIQVNGTQIAGTGTNTYALNFVSGTGITVEGVSGSSSAANGITITNAGVRSVTIGTGDNANKVAVDTNGTPAYLTIPYATNASKLNNLGNHTEAASSTTVPSSKFPGVLHTQGLYMTCTYNDSNTPSTFGNIINVLGTGGSLLLLGWNGSYSTGNIYYRSHRDVTASGGWTDWEQIAYISNIPTKVSLLTNDSGYVTGGPYLPLAGGTMTGVLSMKNDINPRISFIPSSGSSTLGTIYLMGGSSTAYSGIKYKFRQWSYTANSLTRLSYYEDYNLPETPAGLTANASYTILTTKNTSVSGGVITINGTSITPLTSHQSLANYVTLDGNQTISGTKTFTKDITLYASSGDSPKLIFLRSTLNATSAIDWCIYDTSGDLSFRKAAGNGWEEVFRIDYDTNNSTVVGNSLAAGFVKLGSSDLYVLLGGGGHKLLSELGTSGGPYLPLSKINNNTNVNTLTSDSLFYTSTDGDSLTLTNAPFSRSFIILLFLNYSSGDDVRRSRIAISADGSARLFNDRGTAGNGGDWYDILTNNNSAVSGGGSTWGSSITVNINGVSKTLTIPSNPNVDTKVTQTITTTNANYRVLFSANANDTTETTTARKAANLLFNPSTGTLTATTFDGVATTAKYWLFNSIGSSNFNTMYGDNYRGTAWYGGGSNSATNNPLGSGSAFGMLIWRNADGYTALLIMSSGGKLHNRYWNGSTWSDLKTFAFTSDIPTVTNYYWANVKVSSTSSTTTTPTFANTTVNGTLAINGSNAYPLVIDSSHATENGLVIRMSGTNKTWVGYTTGTGSYLYNYTGPHKIGVNDSGVGFIDSNTILHTGNYTSYCAPASHSHAYYPLAGGVNMSVDNTWIGSTMGGGTDYWRIGGTGTGDNGVCQITIGDNSNDYFQIVIADYSGTNYTALLVKSGGTYAPHFYENSDQRLKENIQAILNKDNIPQIKEFDWKESGEHSYGLIAQELEEQGYPELVSIKDDGYKTVNYSAALSLIVGKLQVKIKELEKEIEELKNK